MQIALDAMGGDHAPKEIVKGALEACEHLGSNLILVGRETSIKRYWRKPKRGSIEILNAEDVITNNDPPVMSIRRKKDSSIVKGMNLVKEGTTQAFVSAGSTGALMAGGLFLLGRMAGVDRPAIGTVIPTTKLPTLFLDIGANSDVKAKNLVQFALMGKVYSEEVLGRVNPRIALLNIGQEEDKGNTTIKSAYSSLTTYKDMNFLGNVEPRDLFDGGIDVVVTDGFTGNIFLKTIEGFGKYIFQSLAHKMGSNIRYSVGGALVSPAIKDIARKLDYSEYGGAMFLGLNGLMVKAHGDSNHKAIYNAIRSAQLFHKGRILEKIQQSLEND